MTYKNSYSLRQNITPDRQLLDIHDERVTQIVRQISMCNVLNVMHSMEALDNDMFEEFTPIYSNGNTALMHIFRNILVRQNQTLLEYFFHRFKEGMCRYQSEFVSRLMQADISCETFERAILSKLDIVTPGENYFCELIKNHYDKVDARESDNQPCLDILIWKIKMLLQETKLNPFTFGSNYKYSASSAILKVHDRQSANNCYGNEILGMFLNWYKYKPNVYSVEMSQELDCKVLFDCLGTHRQPRLLLSYLHNSHGINLNFFHYKGMNLLFVIRDYACATYLINNGMNPFVQNEQGDTVPFYILRKLAEDPNVFSYWTEVDYFKSMLATCVGRTEENKQKMNKILTYLQKRIVYSANNTTRNEQNNCYQVLSLILQEYFRDPIIQKYS